jgi:hypothetical protein
MANKPIIMPDGVGFGDETLSKYDEGTWAVSWTATSGTAPSIGNGSLTGNYTRIGRQVTATIKLQIGSTTVTGSAGFWRFSVPFTAAVTGTGSVAITDAGAGYFGAIVEFIDLNNIIGLIPGTADVVSYAKPMTWTSPDVLVVSFSYFI